MGGAMRPVRTILGAACALLVGCLPVLVSGPNRRAGLTPDSLGQTPARVVVLPQGWDKVKWATEWYHLGQGSRLAPLEVFDHLLTADQTTHFFSDANLARYGFLSQLGARGQIVRLPGTTQSYARAGMPVGFSIERIGTPEWLYALPQKEQDFWVGITCAGCHTAEWHVQQGGERVAVRVEGGAGTGNFEWLLEELIAAYEALLDPNHSDRLLNYVRAVLGGAAQPTADQINEARDIVGRLLAEKVAYVGMSTPQPPGAPYALHGRMEAFGGIFNNLLDRALPGGGPSNRGPVNAPVSFPVLWGSNQAYCVQWNASATNVEPNHDTATLGRNVVEALGTFAVLDWDYDSVPGIGADFDGFWSTVPVKLPGEPSRMSRLEDLSAMLHRPTWPEALFGPLDQTLVGKGSAIYKDECVHCHALVSRPEDPEREVLSKAVAVGKVGTDPTMTRNYSTRVNGEWFTRSLEGKGKDPQTVTGAKFGKKALGSELLNNVAGGVIIGADQRHGAPETVMECREKNGTRAGEPNDPELDEPWSLHSAEGYSTTHEDCERRARRAAADDPPPSPPSSPFLEGAESLPDGENPFVTDLTKAELARLQDLAEMGWDNGLHCGQTYDPATKTWSAAEVYRARPLTGIWSSAPYLHNGSVPTLWHLLTPAARPDTFLVGGRDFDLEKVGLAPPTVTASSSHLLDTQVYGNLNTGHTFGASLSDDEKWALIEYLKSL